MATIVDRCAALVLTLLAAPVAVAAQRGDLERKAFEDRTAGYRLRAPKEWPVVPVAPDAREAGLAFQADPPDAKSPLRGRYRIVLAENDEDFRGWIRRIAAEAGKNLDVNEKKPELDEQQQAGAAAAHHRRWLDGGLFVDTWLIEHAPAKVGVIGTVDESDKYAKSWLTLFERSAKSFETFEPKASAGGGSGSGYEDKLASARAEAERTPGWRVVPTPSQKFIITTACENQKFVDEVIDRLERSRKVFEEDYPPPPDFAHVSVVRVCADEESFHRYGKTGGGVAGWFNPGTTELVLYDAKEVDRNMSYAVMTHEAFHQYCHFLFGRSEAHRWFDEGHGDYYGGMKFEGQKPKITARMPGGLERLSVIREMLQLETAKPLQQHLNFNHAQWQGQGPSNVSCYAQSWSVVYMLRQGMLGNVNPKVWKKEYAAILPSYIDTLRTGFAQAYEKERGRRSKSDTDGAALELDSTDLGRNVVDEIWKDAMAASWGKIDLVQFEEDWKLYVKKYLKD